MNFTQGGRRGWQRDTLEISNRQVYLDRDWDNNDVSWNSNFKFNSVISPLFKLVVTGNYKYSENSSRGFGENMLTGSLDTNNTRNYTFYHNSYKIDGGLIYYGERVEMKGGVAVNHQIRNQVERFSVRRQMKDRFFYVNPMWSMRVTFSPTCNMALSYSTKTKLPLLEQLRIEVDEANPLNLSVGNPDLKPTNKHTFRVECNKILPPSSALRTLIYFALIQKPIVSSSRYFMETTYLPEYAYIVEQGATLNTFENSDSGYNLIVKAGYEKFWSFLGKCTFDISYEQLKQPSFIQEESCDLMTNRGTCEIGINTNFSEKVKLSMTSNTIFDSSDSRLGRGNKLLSEGIELNVETMIIPKYLVKATMKYDYCKNFTTHYEMKETILNVEISHKFKYFLMALKGENLLDSKRSNSAGSTEQYDYRRGWSQSGRYVTLIVSKRF